MASAQAITSYTAMTSPAVPLSGRRLAVARAAWLVVTLATVCLDLLSIPLTYLNLSTLCTAPDCDQILLTPARLSELQALGLGAGFHAGYLTGLIVLGTFVYIATGIFIFLRQSRDRMALFASITLIVFGGAGWTDLMQSLAEARRPPPR